jgi:hypothetical protein
LQFAASLILLGALIGVAQGFGLFGSDVATGLFCALVGAELAAIGTGRHAGDLQGSRLLRPLLLVVLLATPAWMILQAVPLPFGWFSDPVWASTSSALSVPIRASVSIDTGQTLLTIVRYCALLASGIITAAFTSRRLSASRILPLLVAVAGLVAATQMMSIRGDRFAASEVGADLIAGISIILSCALLLHLRHEFSPKRRRAAFPRWAACAFAGMAILVLSASTYVISNRVVLIAALLGAGVPVSVYCIRRWSLGTWGILAIFAVASMVLLVAFAVTPAKRVADSGLAPLQESSSGVELLLSDVPLFGRGAGSAQNLLPAYDSLHERPSYQQVAAATVMILDMGPIFFWMFILALVIGAARFIQASLGQSTDYAIAASGAGILLAIGLAVFLENEILSWSASFIATVALGLAFAQSQTGTDKPHAASSPPGPATLRYGVKGAYALCSIVFVAGAAWILIPALLEASGSRAEMADSVTWVWKSNQLGAAATLANVRGDLWAKSALAEATLQELDPAALPKESQVRQRIIRALLDAPYQPKLWLTLAQFAEQFKWDNYDLTKLLKMVYYTGGNDLDLVLARTKLAVGLDSSHLDAEISEMVTSDVNLVVRTRPELWPGLIAGYKAASPAGKAVVERTAIWAESSFRLQLRGR